MAGYFCRYVCYTGTRNVPANLHVFKWFPTLKDFRGDTGNTCENTHAWNWGVATTSAFSLETVSQSWFGRHKDLFLSWSLNSRNLKLIDSMKTWCPSTVYLEIVHTLSSVKCKHCQTNPGENVILHNINAEFHGQLFFTV